MIVRTFGQVQAANGGYGPGFDIVRVGLALSILAYHSTRMTGTYDRLMHSPGWILPSMFVPMFFAVSGFLVAGSAQRLPLIQFLINRAMRIVPALAVVVMVSALILGPLLTAWPLPRYVSSRAFVAYFGNIVGWTHYILPGVFLDSPYKPVVNASLWTIPYEFFCYLVISLVVLTRLVRFPIFVVLLAIATILAPGAADILFLHDHHSNVPEVIRIMAWGRGSGAIQCFLTGFALYLCRDKVPLHWGIALACGAIVCAVALGYDLHFADEGLANIYMVVPMTYLVVFLGLTKFPHLPFFSTGDYSYGIYLWAYPIQQIVATRAPGGDIWIVNVTVATVLTVGVAFLSWHLVEKRALLFRKRFSLVGSRIDTTKDGGQ